MTGASGTVGTALIRHWLHSGDLDRGELKVTAVTHEGGRTESGRVLPRHDGIRVVRGEITKPDLGLDPQALAELVGSTTHVCHLAASTRFGAPLEEIRRVNVGGTRHVFELAERCPRLQHVALASTVFVSGRRTGRVYENDLAHGAGFVNTYERSKYEAESLAHEFTGRVPVSVYRISTILGDSRSGSVQHYTAPHQALRIMSLGLASMLPGTPDYRVNLVPTELVAAAIARLILRPPSEIRTFHLAAPDEKCFTLEEMIETGYRQFDRLIPGWSRRRYPKPAIVSGETFDRFMESVEETGNPLLGGVMGALRHFAHQLLYPKEFDLTNTAVSIPGYEERVPDVRGYFGRVLETCVRTRWGSGVEGE